MKKEKEIIIQCTVCEWQPRGNEQWTCSCKTSWYTFETKGKCPNCQTQWENTWCPGCGKSTPHTEWYKTREEIIAIENSGDQNLRTKKKRFETRLKEYGIHNYRVSHLPYLDHSNEKFQNAKNVGIRMIILYLLSLSTNQLEKRNKVSRWFKSQNIWEKVSPEEREYLQNPKPDEDEVINMAWKIESVLVLGWCLNLVKNLPNLEIEENQDHFDNLEKKIPFVGDDIAPFLADLELRNLEEIYEENLVNEAATSYFRDLLFNKREDETKINRFISFERHRTLNWVRMFAGNEQWDHTDTST